MAVSFHTEQNLQSFRFADEVNGDIPEVDYRGRVKRCDLDVFV